MLKSLGIFMHKHAKWVTLVAMLALFALFAMAWGCEPVSVGSQPGASGPSSPTAPADPVLDEPIVVTPGPSGTDEAPAGNTGNEVVTASTTVSAEGDTLSLPFFAGAVSGSEVWVPVELSSGREAVLDVIAFQLECDVGAFYINRIVNLGRTPGASVAVMGGRGLVFSDFTGLLDGSCNHGIYKVRFPEAGGRVVLGLPFMGAQPGKVLIHVLFGAADGGELYGNNVEVEVR